MANQKEKLMDKKSTMKGLPFPKMQGPSDPNIVRDDKALEIKSNHHNIVSVNTKMNYVTPDTGEIHVRRDISGVDSGYEGATWDPMEVPIYNARRINDKNDIPKRMDKHGYQLVNSDSSSNSLIADIDFMDTNQVIDQYYPDCEELIKQTLGLDQVADVKAFDHNVRINTSTFGPELKGGGGSKAQVPLGMVHGDYTNVSAPRRIIDLAQPPKANDVLKRRLGDHASLLDPSMVDDVMKGKRRFAIVNVWRNIDKENSVEEFPLACIDANSVSEKDFKTLKIHYLDRVGENYFLSWQESQRWNYFPSMTMNEALLIKTWDSHGDFALSGENSSKDNGIATMAFHSAFLDPSSPSNSRPRQSIEVRCIVIYNESK